MGKSSSRPLIAEDDIALKLTIHEKRKFQTRFLELANGALVSESRIPKDVFISEYLAKRLDSLSLLVLERLWQVFAFKGKDEMTFAEFQQAMYLLEHVPTEPLTGELYLSDLDMALEEDRLRLIFAMMDVNMTSKVTKAALVSALKKILIDRRVPDAPLTVDSAEWAYMSGWFDSIAWFILYHFDKHNTAELNFFEFKNYARSDMTLQRVLQMFTPERTEFPSLTRIPKWQASVDQCERLVRSPGPDKAEAKYAESATGDASAAADDDDSGVRKDEVKSSTGDSRAAVTATEDSRASVTHSRDRSLHPITTLREITEEEAMALFNEDDSYDIVSSKLSASKSAVTKSSDVTDTKVEEIAVS